MAMDHIQRHASALSVLIMASTALPGDSEYPSPTRGWYVVLVLLLALTVSFVDRQILSLMVEPVRADLGLSDTEISLLHGFAFAMFYTVLGMPLGRWADRNSRKWMIVVGMVIWCMATVACGFADSFGELFTARMFVGVGEATLSPAAYSLIADYFPRHKRARPMSVYSLGILMGSGLALIIGGVAVQAAIEAGGFTLPLFGAMRSWQAVFVIVGLPGLLVAALMLTVREPVRQETTAGDTSIRGTLRFVRERATILTLICTGFALGGATMAFGFGAWLPSTFIRVHGWQPAQIASAMGLSLLTFGLAGVLVGGWLGDRAMARRGPDALVGIARWGVAGMIPAAPIIGLSDDPYVALAAYCWLNFCLGLPTALAVPALHAITPNEHRGQMAALYLFAANMIGLAAGPVLIAMTSDLVFRSDLAVGKSMTIVTTGAAVLGFILLLMTRGRYARFILPNP